jgi:hypothetical protein
LTAVITFNSIPAVNLSYKYDRLGRMAIENRRLYCERHGYTFVSEVPIEADRPACWAKIPAMLDAFAAHRWVLWASPSKVINSFLIAPRDARRAIARLKHGDDRDRILASVSAFSAHASPS